MTDDKHTQLTEVLASHDEPDVIVRSDGRIVRVDAAHAALAAFLDDPNPHNIRALAVAVNQYAATQPCKPDIADPGSWEAVEGKTPPALTLVDASRWTNNVIGFNAEDPETMYKAGQVVEFFGHPLPIGTEMHSITTIASDDPNWYVEHFWFGTLDIVSYQGTGRINLSTFSKLVERIAPYALGRTRVDVQLRARLRCRTDGAKFGGFNVNVFCEENVCIIANRITLTARAPDPLPST